MPDLQADSRILYCKHAWRLHYHLYQAARSKQNRKILRESMRNTACTILKFRSQA